MPRDGNLLPPGHLLVGGRDGEDGTSGVLWLHRAVWLERGRHVPGRFCPCCPLRVTEDDVRSAAWWNQPDSYNWPT